MLTVAHAAYPGGMVRVLEVRVTPEQFAAQARGRSAAFTSAARSSAASGDVVGALACGWAADLATVQNVLADSILVAGEAPQRSYVQTVSSVVEGLDASWAPPEDDGRYSRGLAKVLQAARSALVRRLEPAVIAQLSDEWPDLSPLTDVEPPSIEQLELQVQARLGGSPVGVFVSERRGTAARVALRAARELDAGETQAAVGSAYHADMCALEAYLVSIAAQAGDRYLLTTRAEWDVVMEAIRGMRTLPSDFVPAVNAVRRTFLAALGEPHATRVQAMLPKVVP